MVLVASWGDRASILGSGGVRECARCSNTEEHLLVEIRKSIKVMFVPVGNLNKGKYLACPICPEMTRITDTEAAGLVRASLQSNLDD